MITIVVGLFGIISLVFLGIGGYLAYNSLYKGKNWVRTVGEIVDHIDQQKGTGKIIAKGEPKAFLGGKVVRYPVVKFTSQDGKEYTFKSGIGSSDLSTKKRYEIGKVLPVMYNPNNPEQASIGDFAMMWIPAIALVVLGALFALAFFSMFSSL